MAVGSPEGLNAHELKRRAMQHCLTTQRTLIRGDGSTSHEGLFDLSTGEFLKQSTHQGYRGDSRANGGFGEARHLVVEMRRLPD